MITLWGRFQGMRYLVIGGMLFLVDLSVFLLLKRLGLPTSLAQLSSRSVGALLGFVAHKRITFRNVDNRSSVLALQGGGYLLATLLTILISPFVVSGIEILIPRQLVVVKIVSEILMVIASYLAMRIVFRSPRAGLEDEAGEDR